jgi:uncharacterized RDD family membrane protein YckC
VLWLFSESDLMACPLCGDTCTCSVPASVVRSASRVASEPPSPEIARGSEDLRVSTHPPAAEQEIRINLALDAPSPLDSTVEAPAAEAPPNPWRNEVASKVNSYKARRKNRSGSMHLDFESAGSVAVTAEPRRAGQADGRRRREICDTNYYRRANAEALGLAPAAPEIASPVESFVGGATAPAYDASEFDAGQMHVREDLPVPPIIVDEPEVEAEAEKKPVSNVLFFPRMAVEPPLAVIPAEDELADPVFDRPRILDVPEDIVPSVQGNLFTEIHLEEPEEEFEPQRLPEFEVPLHASPLLARMSAALMDWLVVWAATMVFAALTWKSLYALPHNKFTIPLLMVIPIALWAVYQYLFLVYGGRTLGMELSRLRLSSFDGGVPTWKQRKKRALHTILSLGVVCMGYLWAIVNVDHLCWHDAASRTYVVKE